MEREQWQKLAVGAGLAAIAFAIVSGRLPRWLRVVLVSAGLVSMCGAGIFAYRYAVKPTVLTIAVGSIDGDAARIMSVIAGRMASTGSLVRLKVVDKGTALDAAHAFSAGETDLAIARGDAGDLSRGRAVVVMMYVVVLIIVPPGSSIEGMDGLKGKTVGVIAADLNRQVVTSITRAYELDRAKVTFKEVGLKDSAQALQSKQVNALLVVTPISEKYLGMLREVFPRSAKLKLGLVPIESAGAIASSMKAFESYDLPKGTVFGSPPVPDDDLTTLRIPFYLVASKKLSDSVVTALTKGIMEARRDLLTDYPALAQISAASTDKDAFIPIHPGAETYFEGEQQTVVEKYGDQFFYVSMALGTLASVLAAVWKFMMKGEEPPEVRPLTRLYALTELIGEAGAEPGLAVIERQIDEILKKELERYSSGEANVAEASALGLATHRLERLIGQRRAILEDRPVPVEGST